MEDLKTIATDTLDEIKQTNLQKQVDKYIADIYFQNVTQQQLDTIKNPIRTLIQNKDNITKSVKEQINNTKEWIKCKNECKKVTQQNMKLETQSTAFFLRLLTKSVINAWGAQNKLTFQIQEEAKLNGTWKNDNQYIDMLPLEQSKKSRLIVGFGPSASGKTYWAKHIITLLAKDDFPTSFLAIDGGVAREFSMVYKLITDTIINSHTTCTELQKNNCTQGFTNLVPAGLTGAITQSIYKDPKKNLLQYLQNQEHVPSLYVPTTASNLASLNTNPANKWNKLINDDKWIGLLIYQHKTAASCTFPNRFKCFGCTESGKRREKKEGKKYSSTAYNMSMKTGNKWIQKATGGSLKIHNSGGQTLNGSYNPSILTEYAVNNNYLFKQKDIMLAINKINSNIPQEKDRINLIYNVGLGKLKM